MNKYSKPSKISPAALIQEARRRGIKLPKQLKAVEAEANRRGLLGEKKPVIAEELLFRQWCEELGNQGLMIDGHRFTLANRRALWEIYDQIPSSIEEAYGKTLILQKAAQMGATVLAMLANLYLAIKFAPCKTLYYLPDRGMAGDLSTTRFMPVIRSIPSLHALITGNGKDEGNTLTRLMPSLGTVFRFLWTSAQPGGVTESFPGDCLFLDEVQGMSLEQIDRVYERLSASSVRWRFLLSTPLFPDLDINAFYLRGDQRKYHTDCSCPAGVILTDVFMEAALQNTGNFPIIYNDGRYPEAPLDYVYYCPSCGDWIPDPQMGKWIPHNPGAAFKSYNFSQILSPTITAREILEAWNAADTADRRQNIACRKLGTPFADASQLLATLEILQRCAEAGQFLGSKWKSTSEQSFMGCDQMGGFIVATLAERLPDGRMAIIYVECIYALDPWVRLSALMTQYNVQVCVLEQLPNVDSARQFAHRHHGFVWLITSYGDLEDFCQWGDVKITKSDRKLSGEFWDRYTLRADRYRVMDWAAARFREQWIVFPNPLELQQEYKDDKGNLKRGPVLRDIFWMHYVKTGLVLKEDETLAEVKTPKREVIKLGIDPHASFSLLCLCLAWFRSFGTTHFILPNNTMVTKTETTRDAVQKAMPGLPPGVVELFTAAEGTCGDCISFKAGLCQERQVSVGVNDPGCELFVRR